MRGWFRRDRRKAHVYEVEKNRDGSRIFFVRAENREDAGAVVWEYMAKEYREEPSGSRPSVDRGDEPGTWTVFVHRSRKLGGGR